MSKIQDRIKKIDKYFRSIEIVQDTLIVKVVFGTKWGVFPSSDNKIQVAKSDSVPNEWFYYGKNNEVSLDDILDLIDTTIEMNLSAEAKVKLLDEKFEELKEIFANEPLDKLQRLQFSFKGRVRKKNDSEPPVDNDELKNEQV